MRSVAAVMTDRGCAERLPTRCQRMYLLAYAHNPSHRHLCPSPSHCDFAFGLLASRPHLTGTNLEYVILKGSSLSSTNPLGQSASLLRTLLSPADTRLSPQHWLGAAGCNSRAGLVRFLLAQADDELWHGEATRGCAWFFEPSTML